MRYFRLNDDIDIVGRWHLGDVSAGFRPAPDFLDVHRLPADLNLSVSVTNPGRQLDFCLTSFAVPVATQKLAEVIATIAKADVQNVPITILGDRYSLVYFIPHCLRELDCLDESKSDFVKWTDSDGRTDLVGQYRMVTKMSIDQRVLPDDAHFFRILRWPVVLVVSEVVRQAMERVGCFGAKFDEFS